MFEIPPYPRAVVLLVAGLLAWPDELPWPRAETLGDVAARAADAAALPRAVLRPASLKAGSPPRIGVCRASQAFDDPDEDDVSHRGPTCWGWADSTPWPSPGIAAPIRLPASRAGCDLSRLCRLRC